MAEQAAPNPLAADPLVDALGRIAASIRGKVVMVSEVVDLSLELEALETLARDVSVARFGTKANPTVILQVAFPTREVSWPLPRSVAMRVVACVTAVIESRGTGVPPASSDRMYRTRDTRSEGGGGTLCGSVFDLGDAVGASAFLPPGSPFYAG